MIKVKFSLNNLKEAAANLARKQQDFFFSFVNSLMFSQYKITSIISLGFLISYVQLLADILIRLPIPRTYNLNVQIFREMIFDLFHYFFIKYWFYIMKILRDSTEYIVHNLLNGRHTNILRIIITIWYTIGISITYLMVTRLDFLRRRFQIVVVSNVHTFGLSEIGPSSQLLVFDEQLPRIKPEREPAYKSQQSTSAEQIRKKISKIPRYSKSYELSTKCVQHNLVGTKNNENDTNNTSKEFAVNDYESVNDENHNEFYDAVSFCSEEEIVNILE